jgi:hypothetical protein
MQQRIGGAIMQLRWHVPADRDAEYHKWYDEEHLYDVVSKPGVLGGRRFARVEGIPYAADTEYGYITIYQLDSPAALETPIYKTMATDPSPWTRNVAFALGIARDVLVQDFPTTHADHQAIGGALLHVTMEVNRADFDEVRRWHSEEHMGDIASVAGVCSARRFVERAPDPESPTVNLTVCYELEDVAVATSPEMAESAQPTAWRKRLDGTFRGIVQVYRQISPESGPFEV